MVILLRTIWFLIWIFFNRNTFYLTFFRVFRLWAYLMIVNLETPHAQTNLHFYYYACNEKWQFHFHDLFVQTRNLNNTLKCFYCSHCSFSIVKSWEFLEYNIQLDCETNLQFCSLSLPASTDSAMAHNFSFSKQGCVIF